MNIEDFTRKAWAQIKGANVWFVIAAIIALGVIWFKVESDRIALEGEMERAKQRRDFQRAMAGLPTASDE